jgi:hypothetical protein
MPTSPHLSDAMGRMSTYQSQRESGRGGAPSGRLRRLRSADPPRALPHPLLLLLPLCAAAAAAGARGALAQTAGLSVVYAFPCKATTDFFDASSLTCQPCNQVRARGGVRGACAGRAAGGSSAHSMRTRRTQAAADAGPPHPPLRLPLPPPQTAGFFPAADGLGCVLCDPQAGAAAAFSGGFSLAAAWQPAGLASGRCSCVDAGADTIVTAMAEGGRRFSRCVRCPSGTTPNRAAGLCSAGPGQPRTPQGDLEYVVAALNAAGAGISLQTATQVRRAGRQAACHGRAAAGVRGGRAHTSTDGTYCLTRPANNRAPLRP